MRSGQCVPVRNPHTAAGGLSAGKSRGVPVRGTCSPLRRRTAIDDVRCPARSWPGGEVAPGRERGVRGAVCRDGRRCLTVPACRSKSPRSLPLGQTLLWPPRIVDLLADEGARYSLRSLAETSGGNSRGAPEYAFIQRPSVGIRPILGCPCACAGSGLRGGNPRMPQCLLELKHGQ